MAVKGLISIVLVVTVGLSCFCGSDELFIGILANPPPPPLSLPFLIDRNYVLSVNVEPKIPDIGRRMLACS